MGLRFRYGARIQGFKFQFVFCDVDAFVAFDGV